MKKKAILAIMLIAMFSIAFAAIYSYDTSTKQITYNLKKGWNLIPMGIEGPSVLADNDTAGAVYIWIPLLERYAGGVVRNGTVTNNDDYSQTLEMLRDYAPSAMWIYLKKDVTVTTYEITNQSLLTTDEDIPTKLAKGWNFIAIWPFMSGMDVEDLFSDCTITKANQWSAETQNWQQASSTQAAQNMSGSIRDYDVGSTMLVYAASECELNFVGEAMTPPPLPD